jgi:hypothetical protein
MDYLLALIQVASFFISLTLAGYLLSRSHFHPLAITQSGMLAAYALMQADQFLAAQFPGQVGEVSRFLWFAYPLPAAFLLRMAIVLKPGRELDLGLDRAWWTLMLPVTVVFILAGWFGDELVDFANHAPGPLYWVFGLYNLIPSAAALWLFRRNYQAIHPQDRMRGVYYYLQIAGLGYLLAMLILLSGVVPPAWVFALILSDMIISGLAATAYEAVSEGQRIERDLSFTFIKTGFITLLVVMPWAVALMASEVQTLPLAIALFFSQGVMALGVPLYSEAERALQWAFFQPLPAEREALQTLLVNAARQDMNPSPLQAMTEDEVVRLTRRALSHMPNLPRLAASPLTEMQAVAGRLSPQASTLDKAQQLRLLLRECIETLRPRDGAPFGTSDEWRFYNALYYPYVEGISPYKAFGLHLSDPELKVIAQWFQHSVPPRTLHNWQNRGAEMIAQILLEREQQAKLSIAG